MRVEQRMSQLAIVRHGSYAPDRGMLTVPGIYQMKRLGRRLLETRKTDQGTTLILSSTAPRALASSEVLSGVLQAPIEEHAELWSDGQHPVRLRAAYDVIQEAGRRADLVIAVTHL